MGHLIYIKGDLFTSDADIVAHGCNCRGGYGSGVAGVMARLYPEARQAYLNKFNQEGWVLGEVQFVDVEPNRIIANMATQDTYGKTGMHVNYDAVRDCFTTLLEFAKVNHMKVAIPKIGAGLGGGDWIVIEKIIRDLLTRYQVNVECYVL